MVSQDFCNVHCRMTSPTYNSGDFTPDIDLLPMQVYDESLFVPDSDVEFIDNEVPQGFDVAGPLETQTLKIEIGPTTSSVFVPMGTASSSIASSSTSASSSAAAPLLQDSSLDISGPGGLISTPTTSEARLIRHGPTSPVARRGFIVPATPRRNPWA